MRHLHQHFAICLRKCLDRKYRSFGLLMRVGQFQFVLVLGSGGISCTYWYKLTQDTALFLHLFRVDHLGMREDYYLVLDMYALRGRLLSLVGVVEQKMICCFVSKFELMSKIFPTRCVLYNHWSVPGDLTSKKRFNWLEYPKLVIVMFSIGQQHCVLVRILPAYSLCSDIRTCAFIHKRYRYSHSQKVISLSMVFEQAYNPALLMMMRICSSLFIDGQGMVKLFSFDACADMVDHLLFLESNDDFVSKLDYITYTFGRVFRQKPNPRSLRSFCINYNVPTARNNPRTLAQHHISSAMNMPELYKITI